MMFLLSLIRNQCTCGIGVTKEFSTLRTLFDTQQNCFPSFDFFRNKFNVRCFFFQYFSFVNAIPQSWKKLLNCSLEQSSTPQILIEEMTCKKIYTKLLSLRSKPPPTCEKRLVNFGYQRDDLRKSYLLPFEVIKEVKLSMFQYKIIDNILCTTSLLFKMKKEDSPRFPFCPGDHTITSLSTRKPLCFGRSFWIGPRAWWTQNYPFQ